MTPNRRPITQLLANASKSRLRRSIWVIGRPCAVSSYTLSSLPGVKLASGPRLALVRAHSVRQLHSDQREQQTHHRR
jgi:hypothetical protein